MSDHIQLKRDRRGGWRWRRVAGNGEIISVGESYTRQWSARRGARRANGKRIRIVVLASLLLSAFDFALTAQQAVSVQCATGTPVTTEGVWTPDETDPACAAGCTQTKVDTIETPIQCPAVIRTTSTGTRSYMPPPPPPPATPPTHSHNASGLSHGVPNFWANPTSISVRDGAWSDPRTWLNGIVPTAGRVWVRTQVSYCQVSDAAIEAIGISGGALRFCPDANTRLTVGTLVVEPDGEIEIGTATRPIAPTMTAEIVIADRAIDTVTDPEQFGTGVLGFGKVTIFGARKLPFVRLAAEVKAGDTTLSITALSLAGWRVGDDVWLPDSRQLATASGYVSQSERLPVADLTNGFRLAAPTTYAHIGARDADGVTLRFLPHVANLTRNVIVRSANPAGTRGHVMFSTRADVDVNFATFKDLGRTLVTALNSTRFDSTGKVTQIGTNQIGRYPIHAHHLFGPVTATRAYQFRLVGNVIDGAKKWGVAIHNSHYGLIQGNVVVVADGAGIVTEDGSESANLFEGNFVSKVIGQGTNGAGRPNDGTNKDLGFEGSCYWFRGVDNSIVDNVATGCLNDYGFKIFLYQLGSVRVPTAPGADTSQLGQYTTLLGNAIPIRRFSGNEAHGAMEGGLTQWWVGAVSNTLVANMKPSVIKDFKVWNVTHQGIQHYPMQNLLIDGFVARNSTQVNRATTAFMGGDYKSANVAFANADIQGFTIGIYPSTNGDLTVRDAVLKNSINVDLLTLWTSAPNARDATAIPPRTVTLQNITTGHPAFNRVPVKDIAREFTPSGVRNLLQLDALTLTNVNGVTGRGYWAQSAPAFVVPPAVQSGANWRPWAAHTIDASGTITPVSGLTNADGWARFKWAIGGAVAPCATTQPGIDGFVCQ